MPSARLQPAHLLVRPLFFAGLLGLAAITLLDRGATRMYAMPWTNAYWLVVALPPLLLLLRLGSAPGLKLPARPWLICVAGAGLTLVASAWVSPYRGPCLQWTALPLAGLATFLLVHDWLQAGPENHARFTGCLTASAIVITLTCTGYWVVDLTRLTRQQIFSAELFEMRNAHPLGHANYTAGLALLCLPWLVRATARQRGPARVALGAIAALALLDLFMSGSRGGLLGLGALGVTALAMTRPGWKRFALITGVIVVAAGAMAVANPRIRALLGPPDLSAEPSASTAQRQAMMSAGLRMGADRPVLGWGQATTPLVYPRYRARLDGGAENILQLHSTPLEIWAGLGGAGLGFGLGFVILAACGWTREPTAAAALAGYALFALTDYQLDVPVFVLAVAALTASLASSAATPATIRARSIAGLATLAAFTLIVAYGQSDRAPALNAEALLLARDPAQTTLALARLRESLALNPDQEIVHFNLGWLLLVPDPAAAEHHFHRAAQLVPDKGGVYFGLGLACLNQNRLAEAANAFALECLNDPRFLASPWWQQPAIAAQRPAAQAAFARFIVAARIALPPGTWAAHQAALLETLAPRLGVVSDGPESSYRRERLGYPVLMRNQDIASPVDLYDVREDPRFATTLPFTLPPKGWLPSPLLLKLLDGGAASGH